MGEFPEAITISAAYREATSPVLEKSIWNPNASMTAAPRYFLITKELVRHCIAICIRVVT
jgi:hypothetical protein